MQNGNWNTFSSSNTNNSVMCDMQHTTLSALLLAVVLVVVVVLHMFLVSATSHPFPFQILQAHI